MSTALFNNIIAVEQCTICLPAACCLPAGRQGRQGRQAVKLECLKINLILYQIHANQLI